MPILEPTSFLWLTIKNQMRNRWPTTIEEQMDGLGLAWNKAGDVFVAHGQPGEEPPKSAWGDGAGDRFRATTANLRHSTKVTGEKMHGIGRQATMFGADIKYTKESIKSYVESHEALFTFLQMLEGAAGRPGSGGADAMAQVLADEIDTFIETMAQRIGARGRGEPGQPRAEFPGTEPGYTPASGQPDPDASPYGRRTAVPAVTDQDSPEKQELARSLKRENDSADILARQGFDVEQNPATKPNGHNPDYLVEGKYFDNYAPGKGTLDTIHSTIQGKVGTEQADRIVVNFADSNVDPQAVRDRLATDQVSGLKEVVGIDQNGKLVQLYP